jgi:hypothetical protein
LQVRKPFEIDVVGVDLAVQYSAFLDCLQVQGAVRVHPASLFRAEQHESLAAFDHDQQAVDMVEVQE